MKRFIKLMLIIVSVFIIASCDNESCVLEEAKTYEVTSNIESLDIRINAADFEITNGDNYLVESNLKYLTVSEKDGVLTIIDKEENGINYTDAMLKVSVPSGTVFENVNIESGAAKLTVDTLSANEISLRMGAGQVHFGQLAAKSKITIEGGAGEITVVSGSLNNLSLNMGVGEANLNVNLLGTSNIKSGVGETNLTIVGSKTDYKLDVKKGIGSITVDGKDISNFTNNEEAQNTVKIEGGIGSIKISFQK